MWQHIIRNKSAAKSRTALSQSINQKKKKQKKEENITVKLKPKSKKNNNYFNNQSSNRKSSIAHKILYNAIIYKPQLIFRTMRNY